LNRANTKLGSGKRVQLLEQRALSASQRRASVIAAGEKREMDRIRAIESRLVGRDVTSRAKHLKQFSGKKNNTQTIEDRWFLATALASRLAIVKAFLIEQHMMRTTFMMQGQSALVIQKQWRLYQEAKRQEIVRKAYNLIRGLIMKVSSGSYHEGYTNAKKEGKACYC
jgi:hypothetical protein